MINKNKILEIIEENKKTMNDVSIDFVYDNRDFLDNSNCFDDAIRDFADSRTSIYYRDIENFLIKNIDKVNDIINMLGWDGVCNDIHKAAQYAECNIIESELLKDKNHIVENLALNYILEEKIEVEDIDDFCNDLLYENIETIDNILHFIEEYTKKEDC